MFERDLKDLLKSDLEKLCERVFQTPQDQERARREIARMRSEKAARGSDKEVILRALRDAERVFKVIFEVDGLVRGMQARLRAPDCTVREGTELAVLAEKLGSEVEAIWPAVEASVKVFALWTRLKQKHQAQLDALQDEFMSARLLAMQNPMFRWAEDSAQLYYDMYMLSKRLDKLAAA